MLETLSPDQIKELNRWKTLDWPDVFPDDAVEYVSDKKIISIGGCGRSGSTLLRVMLDSHPQIACGPESLLFLPQEVSVETLSKKFEIPEATLHTLLEKNNRWEFIEHFQDLYLSITKKRYWADKTSRNVHRFETILKHFPNAHLLHIVRDSRDVVSSLRTHPKRKVVDGVLVQNNWELPLKDCVERWLFAVQDGMKFRNDPRYKEVRYEDLVLHSETTLKEVCEHIGVPFDPVMLRFSEIQRNPLFFPTNVEATLPTYTHSIGRWKKDLSSEEAQFVVEKTQHLLSEFGYVV